MIAVNIPLPQLLDSSMNEICRLHPSKAGYDLNEVPLSSASLILDKETVAQGQFVRMFDTYGSIGVFRVSMVQNKYSKGKNQQHVTLEHGLGTLGDKLMTGYREFGGSGVNTGTVLTQMLALQQVEYWTLGTCDFSDQYQYSTEYELLLNGILSVASPITDANRWAFDMDSFPWELSLLEQETTPSLELRMNRNIEGVSHKIDRRDLRTRLYPLGYGEGVNQLTIASVNSGVAYIEKNTGTYGVVEDVFVDTSITDPQTLMDTAQAHLDDLSEPSVTTEVTALDVFLQTGESLDTPRLGALARVPIAELGISLLERVVRVIKNDIYKHPYDVKITLTNQAKDSTRTTAALLRKSRIGQLYSQGATSFQSIHYADNADASNPMVCDFYLDEQEHGINQVLCKFKKEAFRAYSQAAASGGGSGQTSGSGGGVYDEVAAWTSGSMSNTSAGSKTATDEGGDVATDAASGNTGSNSTGTGTTAPATSGPSTSYTTYEDGLIGSHRHLLYHIHNVDAHSHTVNSHSHSLASHTHTGGAHTHGMNHWHSVSVTISIPTHTHGVTIPAHTHGITYGIYRGATAGSVIIQVDGNTVSAGDIVDNQFDAVPYLEKDADGKITRNTWHTISFTPDSMTRLVVDIQKQTFIRALVGGNY